MELKYIVAIVAGALFLILFIIALVMYFYNRRKQRLFQANIAEIYSEENLVLIDYDCGLEEESLRILSAALSEGQITIDDVLFDGAVSPVDEGIEEITGNYEPD